MDRAPGNVNDLVTNGLVETISATSENPEEAMLSLDYLMSEPVQRKWSEATQRLLPYTCDTRDRAYSDRAKEVAALLSEATGAVAFLDMIEDQACNVPWVWNASQGIPTGDLTPQATGHEHDACVTDLRATKGFE